MQKLKLCIAVVVFLVISGGCKTEEQRNAELLPGKMASLSQFRLLSIMHLVHHFILPYDSKFIPEHIKPRFTDSVLTDGDGYQLVVDFGSGTECRDGFKRRGKCTIDISDSLRTYKSSGKLTFQIADSFGILTSGGWDFLEGFVSITGRNADSATLNYLLTLYTGKQKYALYSTANASFLYGRGGTFNQYQTEITLSGPFGFKEVGSSSFFFGAAINLVQHPGCFSHWNLGTMELSNEAGDKWNMYFDPFSNDACDNNIKVSRKIKHQLFETVYEVW